MNIVVPEIESINDLATFLKSLPEFPSYVRANWDSIEECLADFVEEHQGNVTINNEFSARGLDKSMSVYKDILSSIQAEFKNVEVTFEE